MGIEGHRVIDTVGLEHLSSTTPFQILGTQSKVIPFLRFWSNYTRLGTGWFSPKFPSASILSATHSISIFAVSLSNAFSILSLFAKVLSDFGLANTGPSCFDNLTVLIFDIRWSSHSWQGQMIRSFRRLIESTWQRLRVLEVIPSRGVLGRLTFALVRGRIRSFFKAQSLMKI